MSTIRDDQSRLGAPCGAPPPAMRDRVRAAVDAPAGPPLPARGVPAATALRAGRAAGRRGGGRVLSSSRRRGWTPRPGAPAVNVLAEVLESPTPHRGARHTGVRGQRVTAPTAQRALFTLSGCRTAGRVSGGDERAGALSARSCCPRRPTRGDRGVLDTAETISAFAVDPRAARRRQRTRGRLTGGAAVSDKEAMTDMSPGPPRQHTDAAHQRHRTAGPPVWRAARPGGGRRHCRWARASWAGLLRRRSR